MEDYGFYKYNCKFFDETSIEEQEASGIVYASSFANAVNELESYYGEIVVLEISATEECGSVYEFTSKE